VIYSDGWRGYDGLVDIGFDKHFRVHHGDNEFASGERHITASNLSGALSNAAWQSSMACLNIPFICT
jgi:hypothetical protein